MHRLCPQLYPHIVKKLESFHEQLVARHNLIKIIAMGN
jgi:hypothetical protein